MPKLGLGLSLPQTRVASAPLIPSDGLSLWLKADAGITLSGANVTAWADQSGNGNNATSPTIAPTFVSSSINSKPAISFNNDSSWMQVPQNSIGNSGNISIFIVLNYVSGAVILNKGDAATFENTVWELTTNTGFGFVNNDGEDLSWNTVPVSPATNTPLLLEGFSSAGVSQLAFNETNSGDPSSANVGFNAISQYIGIGGGGDGGSAVSPLDARIAEIIIYNIQVTSPERQQVEAYLMSKYAIEPPPSGIPVASTTIVFIDCPSQGISSNFIKSSPDNWYGAVEDTFLIFTGTRWELQVFAEAASFNTSAGQTVNFIPQTSWNVTTTITVVA